MQATVVGNPADTVITYLDSTSIENSEETPCTDENDSSTELEDELEDFDLKEPTDEELEHLEGEGK